MVRVVLSRRGEPQRIYTQPNRPDFLRNSCRVNARVPVSHTAEVSRNPQGIPTMIVSLASQRDKTRIENRRASLAKAQKLLSSQRQSGTRGCATRRTRIFADFLQIR